MQIEVLMPKMGESITEGKVVKWYKKPGEKVERDEVLLEISTDKVDTEIPSSVSGILSRILVGEQETVQVGSVIAYIEREGDVSKGGEVSSGPDEAPADQTTVEVGEDHSLTLSRSDDEVSPGRNGERFYSPVVKNIAKSEGISSGELASIDGSGVSGRITKEDLLNYIGSRQRSAGSKVAPKLSTPAPGQPRINGARELVTPMDNMRQRIMEHMVASRDTSVHVAAITEADLSGVAVYIGKHGADFEKSEGFKLTYMPFIAHACVKALKDFPLVNSSIDGTNIIQHDFVNLGIAVAIETTGLLVPVIKGADEKNVLGLARAIYDVATKSRTKRLTGDDTIGSTFSITNYGVFGNLVGVPIINQPNVAILGVGAVKKRAVVVNDAIGIRNIGFLTLSFDHRLIDGALGGRFLERIVNYLEAFDGELTK